MSKQPSFERYIEQKLMKLRRTSQKQTSSKAALKGFQDILIAICIGVGLIATVQMAKVPLLQVLLMFVVINKTVKNIARLQARYQDWAAIEAPVYAVKEAIAEMELAAERCHGGIRPSLDTTCCVRYLSFSYGRNKVLHQINLDIQAKAMTVIMGVSGVGKSTLIDLILGFYDPEEGQILVDGVPLTDVDIADWRKLIGYVPQDLALLHDTILVNITLGDEMVTSKDVEDALRAAGAWDFVAELPEGVMTVVGEKGFKLSGGQRQRIALARAIAVRPKLLILDEVTSALDTKTEREICHTLSKLKDSTAILAITHRPQLLEFADRAYRLQDGLAEEFDTPARLVV
jgi:ATP-binding cassette subfamily C protein